MKHHPARDQGSALIFALLAMTSLAIILGAVLTLVGTSQSTTIKLRGEATASYTVDGAVQQAVNTMQRGTFINDESSSCFTGADTAAGTPTDTMVIPDSDGTGSVAVVCSGTPGSGAQNVEVPITSVNKPGNAILTLGSTEGLFMKSDYNFFSSFDVGGPVFSHGPIRTNGRNLKAREYVIARGACPDASLITPSPQCNYGSPDTRGADPNYSLPTPVPTYRSVPSGSGCWFLNPVVTFEPGYYDDAAALNALTTNSGDSCTTFWFKPGTYYFDFHNGDNTALPANLPAASAHEWRITDGRLIGGTRTGALNANCVSPLKSQTNNGVRFVFGGNSRLVVDGGSMSLCGTYSSTAPPVAVHGVRTGSETSQSANGLAPTGQSAVSKFSRSTDSSVPNAWRGTTVANDSVTARWVKSGNTDESGYLETTGYTPAAAVPAGSVIDSATVKVRRSNPNARANDTRQVVLTVAGNSCTLTVPDTAASALVTENLNVLTACPADFVQDLHSTGVPTSGTILRYNVTLDIGGTETLDQLTLDVTYRAPAFRSQQGAVTGDSCVLGNAYIPAFAPGGATGCSLLDLHLAPLSGIWAIFGIEPTAINGTVYSPHASISLQMNGITASAFRSGVIARSVYLRQLGVIDRASAASVPFSSMGTNPSAYLTAYVCETASTCSDTAGVPKVRAKMTLVGQDPTVDRRTANITSYSVLQ